MDGFRTLHYTVAKTYYSIEKCSILRLKLHIMIT
jgi:hypothetical protein